MTPICAFDIDPSGRAVPVASASAEPPAQGYRWLHLDLTDPATVKWIHAELPERVAAALTQAETRPRCDVVGDGMILNLRAINLNDGADVADMISLRCWVSAGLVITARLRRVFAADDMRLQAEAGHAPADAGVFVATLTDRLVDRIEGASVALTDAMDAVDDRVLDADEGVHDELGPVRRRAIMLLRFARPQRDAVAKMSTVNAVVDEHERLRLAESALRLTRAVEEMEAVRDRGAAAADHLDAIHAARHSRNSYALSVVRRCSCRWAF